MKRLVFFKSKDPNFEKQVNNFILEEQYRVLDVTMLEWNKVERAWYLGLVVEEQMKFFRQNLLMLMQKKPEDLAKDLDDFSSVMSSAKNVDYCINFIKTYVLSTPKGTIYCALVFYED